METVSARLNIEALVDCPYCEHLINLMDEDDTDGYDHNEEGYVIQQAIPEGHWHEEHEKFTVDDVVCANCKGVFNVKEMDW